LFLIPGIRPPTTFLYIVFLAPTLFYNKRGSITRGKFADESNRVNEQIGYFRLDESTYKRDKGLYGLVKKETTWRTFVTNR